MKRRDAEDAEVRGDERSEHPGEGAALVARAVARDDIARVPAVVRRVVRREAGGLGSLGGARMTPDQLRDAIRRTLESRCRAMGLPAVAPLDPVSHQGDRITGPLTGIWVIIFVLPMFLLTPDYPAKRPIRDYIDNNVMFDILLHDLDARRFLVETVGPDRLVVGDCDVAQTGADVNVTRGAELLEELVAGES